MRLVLLEVPCYHKFSSSYSSYFSPPHHHHPIYCSDHSPLFFVVDIRTKMWVNDINIKDDFLILKTCACWQHSEFLGVAEECTPTLVVWFIVVLEEWQLPTNDGLDGKKTTFCGFAMVGVVARLGALRIPNPNLATHCSYHLAANVAAITWLLIEAITCLPTWLIIR